MMGLRRGCLLREETELQRILVSFVRSLRPHMCNTYLLHSLLVNVQENPCRGVLHQASSEASTVKSGRGGARRCIADEPRADED